MGTLQPTNEKTQTAYIGAVIGLLLFTATAYLATGVEPNVVPEVVVALAPEPSGTAPTADAADTVVVVVPPAAQAVWAAAPSTTSTSAGRQYAVIIRINPVRAVAAFPEPSTVEATTTMPPFVGVQVATTTSIPATTAAPTTTTTKAPPVTRAPSTTVIPVAETAIANTAPPPASPPSSLELAASRSKNVSGGSEEGVASWFGAPASTCAHKTLPKGTTVRVIRLLTGEETTCRVADRGPYIAGRVIDLSTDTFERLAPIGAGVFDVRIEW